MRIAYIVQTVPTASIIVKSNVALALFQVRYPVRHLPPLEFSPSPATLDLHQHHILVMKRSVHLEVTCPYDLFLFLLIITKTVLQQVI